MWTELLLAAALADAPSVESTPEGDTLVVVPDHRVALVDVRLALPVGRLSPWWWEADAAAAWHLPLTDPALSARIDRWMSLSLSEDDFSTTLSATVRTENLDHAVTTLRAFLDGETASREGLRAWQRAGRGPWDRPRRALSVLVDRLLLDPRDLRRQPAPAPPRRLRRLQRTRAALVGLADRIIGFSGDVTVEQARQAAAAMLPPPLPEPPDGLAPSPLPISPTGGGERNGWLPGSGQGAVLLVRDSLSRTDPDFPALQVALHVLAGGLRSRLLVRLRQESGLIYSLTADPGAGPLPGVMTIAIPTRASNLRQTSEQAREVLAVLADLGITETERQAAVAALSARIEADTPVESLQDAMVALRHGWPLDHRQREVDAAASLSLEATNEFIARFFSPESVVLIRVLPAPGLSPPSP